MFEARCQMLSIFSVLLPSPRNVSCWKFPWRRLGGHPFSKEVVISLSRKHRVAEPVGFAHKDEPGPVSSNQEPGPVYRGTEPGGFCTRTEAWGPFYMHPGKRVLTPWHRAMRLLRTKTGLGAFSSAPGPGASCAPHKKRSGP